MGYETILPCQPGTFSQGFSLLFSSKAIPSVEQHETVVEQKTPLHSLTKGRVPNGRLALWSGWRVVLPALVAASVVLARRKEEEPACS